MAPQHQPEVSNKYDLVSWVLGNQSYDQNQPIFIDPDHPERSYTALEARTAIRQLIAGLKAAGLNKGDAVCIHAFNDVGTSLGRRSSSPCDDRCPINVL